MSQGDDKDSGKAALGPRGAPVARGASLRRTLALALPVPDIARDAGGALVVDIAALDLGADEIAEPLSASVDASAAPAPSTAPRGAS